jgi:hypothetical protein
MSPVTGRAVAGVNGAVWRGVRVMLAPLNWCESMVWPQRLRAIMLACDATFRSDMLRPP